MTQKPAISGLQQSAHEQAGAQKLHSNAAAELSVIVPTFNEVENVPLVVEALKKALDGQVAWEVIFVDDDSPDGTAEAAKVQARIYPNVRCIHRIGRRGLSSACIEGVLACAAPHVAVMDADLQHDESKLLNMLQTARESGVDIVVGSRYAEGGDTSAWDKNRENMSRFASRLARMATKVHLSDPMSGFFLIKREVFNRLAPRLSALGFKILLDLFATARRPLTFEEVGFAFRSRRFGESKLDSQAAWDFLMLLADKSIGRMIPVRFISFALIGGSGIFIHLAVFNAVFELNGAVYNAGSLDDAFTVAKAFAIGTAIIWNYILNNLITYRDRRLKGARWWTGLLTFTAVCSVGAVADFGISKYLYAEAAEGSIMRRFSILPNLVGIAAAAVWNYAVTAVYTWRSSK